MDTPTLRILEQEKEARKMGATSYTELMPPMRRLVDDVVDDKFGPPEGVQWIESRIPEGYEDMSPGLIARAMYRRGVRYVPDADR
ncbi:hypothetical protein [Arthrobacter sp. SDTb3-6]|uniref:hypothetical protein n=1 Tax=Arthrobacter sp. SDTb3-6 TaxID=2713571 RepID=UPI00159DB91F|nr:hypothetical protein [Arthrobacter sp. SDTb3-6]NVM97676.1 hypothetical protein [Arthrobacter sp. SDTb3-6]